MYQIFIETSAFSADEKAVQIWMANARTRIGVAYHVRRLFHGSIPTDSMIVVKKNGEELYSQMAF